MSYSDALFCDRAVVGRWARSPGEALKPYTIAETMDAGWCWQIDHEHFINRGYVYCASCLDHDAARAEFLRKIPKIAPDSTRIVKYRAGRYRHT